LILDNAEGDALQTVSVGQVFQRQGLAQRVYNEGAELMAIWLIILGGLLSIVYGVVTIQKVMAADAGSARMQEISAAIAEGAQAYLRRQYATIAAVGVVICILLGFLLGGPIGMIVGAVVGAAIGAVGAKFAANKLFQ